MSSASSILRRTLSSLFAPYFLLGSICFLVVLVVFPQRAAAVEGTLNVTATTASYSGTLTQGGNQPIRTAFGPLRLDYKSGSNTYTTGFLMREGDGNITIGANITSADFYSTSKLRVLGIIESTTGGFKFPDGTTQTTAAAGTAAGWTDGGTNVYLTTTTDSVGIGTTAPTAQLHVVNAIKKEFAASSGGQSALYFMGNDGAGNLSEYINTLGTVSPTLITAGSAYRRVTSLNASGNYFYYMYANPGAAAGAITWKEYMTLDADNNRFALMNSGGNVGIGTIVPATTLDVNGSTRSQYYQVTAGNGYGLCFWIDCTNYKMHMGSAAEYWYGPVTDYSIKTTMSNTAGRGWTWGTPGAAPVAAINTAGAMQVASTLTGVGNVNSSGGALQTAGVTRIDNSGVGTFAAGTTIGGVAPGAETAGQIAFFAAACPTGWTEYTALRGRVPVGTPLSGTNAGTVGTALTNLENRTHTHSFSATTGGPSSTNNPGAGNTDFDVSSASTSHTHGVSGTTGTATTSNIIPYIQLTACQKS
ncbi:MAG: hypothetical protein AAB557_04370 [Patescibacteria group bacterium]